MKSDIIDSFSQMVKDKKMDRDVLESIIKDVFGLMIKKKYGINAPFDVIVNMDKGDIEMYISKSVVDEVTNLDVEIDVETAREKSGENLEPGDDYVEVIDIVSFGRRHIVNLKQNLNQRIREIEKEIVYNEYKDLVAEIIVGEIYQIKPNYILMIHDGNEIEFPKNEQIPKERYKKGESIRVYIKEVQRKQSGPPKIIVSRGCSDFLRKLFELEIPEIYDGIIEIKGISREPGERAKVSVISYDDRIDAVGACVGMKGIRIHSIVRELANENIDVINYTEDIALYIARALAPAKLKDIYLDKENKVAKIIADDDQISLIIGKNGQNIKLASKLTGYEIDVERKEGSKKKIIEEEELPFTIDDEEDEEEMEEVEEVEEESEIEENEDEETDDDEAQGNDKTEQNDESEDNQEKTEDEEIAIKDEDSKLEKKTNKQDENDMNLKLVSVDTLSEQEENEDGILKKKNKKKEKKNKS